MPAGGSWNYIPQQAALRINGETGPVSASRRTGIGSTLASKYFDVVVLALSYLLSPDPFSSTESTVQLVHPLSSPSGASMAGSEELGLREDTLRVLAAFLRRGEAAVPVPTPPR